MSIQKLLTILIKLEKDDSIVSSDYLKDTIPVVNKKCQLCAVSYLFWKIYISHQIFMGK